MNVDSVPARTAGSIVADSAGRILFISESLAAELGCSREEALHSPLLTLLPMANSEAARPVFEDECVSIRLLPMEQDKSVSIYVLNEDAVGSAPANLPGGERQQVAKLTHDLNNVFTIVYAAIDMVLAHDLSEEEKRESLLEAQQAARRGSRLVTEIREIIRREANAPARPADVSVDAAFAPLEGHEKILLATSQKSLRLLLRAVLAYRGYEVLELEAPPAALQASRDESPAQLVITDDEALATIWDEHGGNAFLLLLAPEKSDSLQGRRINWLPTPFDNAALLARVRSILDAQENSRIEAPGVKSGSRR